LSLDIKRRGCSQVLSSYNKIWLLLKIKGLFNL
jgi:hypothetical protein